ncbi:AAA family ATPase [Halanaerobacter jeridensis]|uniref:MoxR-like ATPase n=1 Tax=Halanaerobacter jeridensis TaxID=706427 RepID=A0A939BNI2_9FIRM|nr:MoxR family ATPase [Halanaerobacter jeridensis]MBM7555532.1 MoxR-like ATPase [Halanaerobacter jeridensis]
MEKNQINEKVQDKAAVVEEIKAEIGKVIIGQEYMVDRILIAIFTGGHILLEGVPDLAKSLTANITARILGIDYKRIQFTPDLLPADVVGTEIYNHNAGEFTTEKGPIFSNLILADEINRAPAKVQSALLEAMQEKQVTIGDETYTLDKPFFVLATQNPLEQQGTYPLPEAQQDRFMLKLTIDYPAKQEEKEIINRFTTTGKNNLDKFTLKKIVTKEEILELQELVKDIYVDENLKDYVLDIIFKTREDSEYISCGASPRASINLILAAKGKAFLEGRGYVVPEDIKEVVYDVLRHRILLSYEAEAEGVTQEDIIYDILESVNLP